MGPKPKPQLGELGRRFGRPDIERCDLFIDDGFLDWGRYSDRPTGFNESAAKGRQIYSSVPSGGHKKCGLQGNSGYFDDKFYSVSVNVPYVERWRLTGRPPPHPLKGPWIPAHPASKHSSPGDNYGTFTKNADYKAFSPLTKPFQKQKELINFLTNPSKKGNCGYLDICINKYPPHTVGGKTDSYVYPAMLYSDNWKRHKLKIRNGPFKAGCYPKYFDENPYRELRPGPTYVQRPEKSYGKNKGIFYPPAAPKMPGNNHDGCFDKFPSWSAEPYLSAADAYKKLSKPRNPDLVFRPEPRLKSYYTVSTVNYNADIACNERTWKTMKPITYPQFNL